MDIYLFMVKLYLFGIIITNIVCERKSKSSLSLSVVIFSGGLRFCLVGITYFRCMCLITQMFMDVERCIGVILFTFGMECSTTSVSTEVSDFLN